MSRSTRGSPAWAYPDSSSPRDRPGREGRRPPRDPTAISRRRDLPLLEEIVEPEVRELLRRRVLAQALPQVVSRFSRDHRGVEISIETQRLDNLLEYVETGIVDVGFAMEPHPRPTLEYLPLAQLDMVCACPADSPLTQLSFVSPTDLRDVPLINARTSSRISTLVQEAFRRSAVDYAPAIDVRFMNVAGHFVEEGLGVTIMDELTASSKRYGRLKSLPFKPKTQVTVSAIVPSDRMQQRLTQALIKHAREEIAARLAASTA